MAWREHITLNKPQRFICETKANRFSPVLLYKNTEVLGVDDLNRQSICFDGARFQPTKLDPLLHFVRACVQRSGKRVLGEPFPACCSPIPSRCNMERTDPGDRRNIFAASVTGTVVFHVPSPDFRFFPSASPRGEPDCAAICKGTLYPLRAAAAAKVDVRVCAWRIMPSVNGKHRNLNFADPKAPEKSHEPRRMYDFCTIGANDLEVIDSRWVYLVDLVGIEPTTSSMPWKRAPSCATGPLLRTFYSRNLMILAQAAAFRPTP